MKKAVNVRKNFFDFLNALLETAKLEKDVVRIKICNAFLDLAPLKEKTVKDILQTESSKLRGYRYIGPKRYFQLCGLFLEAKVDPKKWPLLKEYRTSKEKRPPRLILKPVKVKTDPETVIFQLKLIDDNGLRQEVAHTPREAFMFFQGVRAARSLEGLPTPNIPPIPVSQ